MASIVYNVTLKGQRIEYRNSSAIELDSRSSVAGSTLMIFGETFLNVTFSGTSISIHGDSLPLRNSDTEQPLDSKKDAFIDGIPTTVTFTQSNSGLLYKSPKIPEGLHSLSFPNVSNLYIDYMLVTPGNQTDILGETLLIDDSDSSLFYEGDWVRDTPYLLKDVAQDPTVYIPIANSTMRSDSPGASVSFSFTGTVVSVFGFCEQEKDILNVDVYLDGVLTPKTVPDSDEVRYAVSPLFSTSGLSEASHTLKLQLTNNGINNDSARTNLSIDYFTYVPSFRSFATKPITDTSPTAPTNKVLAIPTPTNSPSIKPSGARLAGLIFGVIGIALFLALLILRRRIFKRRVRPPPEPTPFALGGRRKDVAAEQTPRRQQQDLPPNTSGSPLRGILKKESESQPVHEVKASPREAKPPITGKTTKTKQLVFPSTKESSSQQPSNQTSPV